MENSLERENDIKVDMIVAEKGEEKDKMRKGGREILRNWVKERCKDKKVKKRDRNRQKKVRQA